MKLTKSKQQLAEIIRASGAKWSEKYVVAVQDKSGWVRVYTNDDLYCCVAGWVRNEFDTDYQDVTTAKPITQYYSTKLTREEYLEYVASVTPAPVPADDPSNVTVDLVQLTYDQLCESARRSNWIPPEYTANDWITDCGSFLERGVGAFMNTPISPTIEQLIQIHTEATRAVEFTRTELERLEQAQRDAKAAVEVALVAAGWGDVSVVDTSTWKVGDMFKVVGVTYPKHNFNIGDIVTMVRLSTIGDSAYERERNGVNQYISAKDLRKL